MTIVLDNSVTMRWCFGDGGAHDLDYAASIARRMREDSALVPSIWGLEVANVLARAELSSQLPAHISTAFLNTLRAMRIATDPDTSAHALTDTLVLARRHRLSAYDAAYLELALRCQLPLATLDADLRKACKRAGAEIAA